ncbi:MAG: hypothetical protein GOVbin2833_1 [Prokaryotic dsDNA virus sp.]|nr:MAG: hypothetical protein GOVbin2833_1 [Prokaryotic dsDNA virus sp.]|tara:strand:- start:35440 stop:36261 length:822 start_codon:yes stop_codon:yes gene_type:complete
MGNFFDDLGGWLFGASPEYQTTPWGQGWGQNAFAQYQQQQQQAMYQYMADMQDKVFGQLDEAKLGYERELGYLDDQYAYFDQQEADLKAMLGEQRDTALSRIGSEYDSQKEDIASTAVTARGTNRVSLARRGMMGTTVYDQQQGAIDTKENKANQDLAQWKSDSTAQAESQYTTGLNTGMASIRQGRSAIDRGKQEAERAYTSFKEQILANYEPMMNPIPEFNWQSQQYLGQNFGPGQNQWMSSPGQSGLVTDVFAPMFAGSLGLGLGGWLFS